MSIKHLPVEILALIASHHPTVCNFLLNNIKNFYERPQQPEKLAQLKSYFIEIEIEPGFELHYFYGKPHRDEIDPDTGLFLPADVWTNIAQDWRKNGVYPYP